MKKTISNILFLSGMAFSIWFGITGMFWPYLMALFVAYPFGILALIIGWVLKRNGDQRYRIIFKILLVGVILSVGVFLGIWFYNG